MINRMVFWLNEPSLHTAPLVREMARRYPVSVVTEWDLSSARRAQGWSVPDYGAARVIVGPTSEQRRVLEFDLSSGSHHFFFGFGAYPQTRESLANVKRCGEPEHIAIFTEPWDTRGLRGALRPAKFRMLVRQAGKGVDSVLVAGELGMTQFQRAGIPRSRIFPFPYFVETRSQRNEEASGSGSKVRLFFAGQLINRKAPIDLVEALKGLDGSQYELHIHGSGNLRGVMESRARDYGAPLVFHGPTAHQELMAAMAVSDVLVLPAKFDGWGVVVNEALAAGCRVIVSDRASANIIVRASGHGRVYRAGRVRELHDAISAEIHRGPRTLEERTRISEWMDSKMSPRIGAEYLTRIMTRSACCGSVDIPWERNE